MRSTVGCATEAMARTSICCSPPERLAAGSWERRRSWGNASSAAAVRVATPGSDRGWVQPASSRCSATESDGNTPRPPGAWPMPSAATRSARRFVTSVPPSSTVPDSTGTRPQIALRMVDFPAPFVPSRASVEPAGTSRSTPSMIRASPRRTRRPRTRNAGTSAWRSPTSMRTAAGAGAAWTTSASSTSSPPTSVAARIHGRSTRFRAAVSAPATPLGNTIRTMSVPIAVASTRAASPSSQPLPTKVTAPITAPAGEAMPPTTVAPKVLMLRSGVSSWSGNVWSRWTSRHPASAAIPPDRPKAVSRVLVVPSPNDSLASALSRWATMARPGRPRRTAWLTQNVATNAARHRKYIDCSLVRSMPRNGARATRPDGNQPVEPDRSRYELVATLNASVTTARYSPRRRSAGQPDDDGDRPAGGRRADERHGQVVALDGREPGPDGGTDGDEAHLAEGDLARPAGEDDERHADDGEDRHGGRLELVAAVEVARQVDRHREQRQRPEQTGDAHHRTPGDGARERAGASVDLPRRGVALGAGARARHQQQADEDHHRQHDGVQIRVLRVVPRHGLLDHAQRHGADRHAQDVREPSDRERRQHGEQCGEGLGRGEREPDDGHPEEDPDERQGGGGGPHDPLHALDGDAERRGTFRAVGGRSARPRRLGSAAATRRGAPAPPVPPPRPGRARRGTAAAPRTGRPSSRT